MKEHTYIVKLNLVVNLKTAEDIENMTIKDFKFLLAQQAAKDIAKTRYEDLAKNIVGYTNTAKN